jgi:hypothetical protein
MGNSLVNNKCNFVLGRTMIITVIYHAVACFLSFLFVFSIWSITDSTALILICMVFKLPTGNDPLVNLSCWT